MNNGWTGGQYSLYRAVFGVFLAVRFALLMPQAAGESAALAAGGVLLGVLVAIGVGAHWTVLLLLAATAHAHSVFKSPLDDVIGLVPAGLLMAILSIPPAPYGSWTARGRTDPGASWRMPPFVYAAAWIMLALAYGYSGFEASLNSTAGSGLLLAFPLLALFRPLRPWLWLAMFLLLMLIAPTGREPLAFGLLLLHGLTFDPAWIKGEGSGVEPIFYDGHCGLCHRAVRFVLAEDVNGAAFRFAPLDSDAFRAAVSEEERAKLPDSMVVKTADGAVLTRSAAFLHILRRLGGLWRVVALVGGLVPTPLRDAAYNGVARVRRQLFAAPSDACPVLPKELRQRFDY